MYSDTYVHTDRQTDIHTYRHTCMHACAYIYMFFAWAASSREATALAI